jgi:hypothetical protein
LRQNDAERQLRFFPQTFAGIFSGKHNSAFALDRNSEIAMGGTGNLPVPSGYQPDGTGVDIYPETNAQKKCGAHFHSGRLVAARHRPVAWATHRNPNRQPRNSRLKIPAASCSLKVPSRKLAA